MFDPTIFENLKVALENIIYDLDNLDGKILVTGRKDLQDMAVMSREFSIRFDLVPATGVTAEVRLEASLKDLAAEILEIPGEDPGCSLSLRFSTQIKEGSSACERIRNILNLIWEPEVPPLQTLSYVYGEPYDMLTNQIELSFPKKINESNMSELAPFVDHVIRTLEELAWIREEV